MEKIEYFKKEHRQSYAIYFVKDNRNNDIYMGYTMYGDLLWDYMKTEEPDFSSSRIHNYIWQEGPQHFTYFCFPVSNVEPDYFQQKAAERLKRVWKQKFLLMLDVVGAMNMPYLEPLNLVRIDRVEEQEVFETKEYRVSSFKGDIMIGDVFFGIYEEIRTTQEKGGSFYYEYDPLLSLEAV